MAMFIRAKRVTDPLDDRVKAHLRGYDIPASGYSSSGSEHDATDSSCFSSLVHDFFETDDREHRHNSGDDGIDADSEGSAAFIHAVEMLRDILNPNDDQLRIRLLSDTSSVAKSLAELLPTGSVYRRAVMSKLRAIGYNAGLCKVKWEHSSGLPAGNYEYIDLVVATDRYIVDLDFTAEFEVVRPTDEYERFMAALPRVMVGTAEEVRQVVKLAAKTAGRSLRSRGLSVPPWRKGKYMLAKWLGPYRRTANTVPSSAGAVAAAGGEVKCMAVIGFKETAGVVVPAVAPI